MYLIGKFIIWLVQILILQSETIKIKKKKQNIELNKYKLFISRKYDKQKKNLVICCYERAFLIKIFLLYHMDIMTLLLCLLSGSNFDKCQFYMFSKYYNFIFYINTHMNTCRLFKIKITLVWWISNRETNSSLTFVLIFLFYIIIVLNLMVDELWWY